MAKLVIKTENDTSTIDLTTNPEASLESQMEDALDKSTTIHNIIDNNQVIKDPGFLDLSQLSALSGVQPNTPGNFPLTASKISFSDSEKATLEAIIKKLASVCHTHGLSTSYTGSSPLYQDNCGYEANCTNHANNTNDHRSDNCNNGGQW